jgi:hypothetical protein
MTRRLTMPWTWRFEKADGRMTAGPVELPEETFTTQADAETWVGENWRALAAAGVEQVTLIEDDAAVYGPMSLTSAR